MDSATRRVGATGGTGWQPGSVAGLLLRRMLREVLLLACLAVPAGVQAGYSQLFLFGDSLSDTGNNAFVFDNVIGPTIPVPAGTLRTPTPTPNDGFIAQYPYATDRYSNGAVWAEVFAQTYGHGISALASNLGGTNYANGGARAGDPSDPAFPATLTRQVATFLAQHPQAPADALYVVAGGGNDARDLITKAGQVLASGGDPTALIAAGAATYATYVDAIVGKLEQAGAKRIIVWDTPNAGVAPAILAAGAGALGTAVADAMNAYLWQALSDDLALGVSIFDSYGFVTAIANNPAAYGLVNATNACAALSGVNCDQYFFWDGIHPTAAGHRLLAEAMVAFVPEPATGVLLVFGLFGLSLCRRRKGQ